MASKTSEQRFKVGDYFVYQDNGTLVCTSSAHHVGKGMPWCADIEKTIKWQKDADWCFGESLLVVPIIPTLGLFAEVRLDEEIKHGARKMFMPTQGQGNFSSNLDFVGFLSPGEGRLIIRNNLLAWAMPQWKAPGTPKGFPGRQCTSGSHSLRAENAMKDALKDNNQAFIQGTMWSVVMESMCLTCATDFRNNAYGDDSLKDLF